ncbi:23S rRNA (adenine-N6)-dimethyltransferase [Lipingzhangella halophila]|uniref:23S rRNA (Adenine-N6)-dimethyltransferase n=1 Tax=Lipingzhangella halophila TaxID=1783352 RepID=A0A7W7W0K5_9ACTN|nr:23S ribosomal RNA methyltransferase Erm [Lipingzhangella halophila]MBB4929716.1 23S rRNA (adenine-N6)-dimethyltransferase [Lipingzhangella halophila]
MSSRHPRGGPHELGQNFLVDRAVISAIEELVARTTGPIVEIGAGSGTVTMPLSRLGRPVTAVEVDPRSARHLNRRVPDNVTVLNEDILRVRLPRHPHVIVGNLPFHLTTSILRRILAAPHWHTAVLLAQWEVARRRAGVGGATMLTARSWPWYEFALHSRVPARSFRPAPSVDGGLFTVTRRVTPLVSDQRGYQRFVEHVFTGPGRGLREILTRTGLIDRGALNAWLRSTGLRPDVLPKDLTANQWASLWERTGTRVNGAGGSPAGTPPRTARRRRAR